MAPLDSTLPVLFAISLFLIVYAYFVYPPLIWGLARVFGRVSECKDVDDADLPHLSFLIAAYNEETEIEGRIRNALALDYPPEKLEIAIGSDGSDDGTEQIVRRFANEGVRLFSYGQRRGKASILNASIPELLGEIIVLSDANTFTEPSAARRLARWFQLPEVGAVCGRLELTDPRTGRNVDSLYWKYENFLKECEGRLGGLLGANGAIYAIRRELYVPIPAETIIDDFVIPLLAMIRSGCHLVYDRESIAHEESPADLSSEFHRRSRIGAGGFQSIAMLWKLLDPRRGWVAFTFLSHKILRWICPFLLLFVLVGNLLLLSREGQLYPALMTAQVGFYLVAALATYLPVRYSILKPLRMTSLFVGMNAALLVGFFRWLRGIQKGTWARTSRVAKPTGVS